MDVTTNTVPLPLEVMSLILSTLDPLSLYRVSLASTRLRGLATQPAMWEQHCETFWPSGPRTVGTEYAQRWKEWRAHRWKQGMQALIEAQKHSHALHHQKHTGSTRDAIEPTERHQLLPSIELLIGDPASSRPTPPDFYSIFTQRIRSDQDLLRALRNLLVPPPQNPVPSVSSSGRNLTSLCKMVLKYGQDARDILHKLSWDQTIDAVNAEEVLARFGLEISNFELPTAYDVHIRHAGQQGIRGPSKEYHLALRHHAEEMLSHLQRAEGVGVFRQIRERDLNIRYSPDVLRTLAPGSQESGESQKCATKATEAVEAALSALSSFRGGNSIEIARYLDLLALSCYFSLYSSSIRSRESRDIVRQIVEHLQGLGSKVADPLSFLDIDNSFVHLGLLCPDLRATLPLTCTLIFCAVARRLGIAAALCNTPGRIVAVVEGNASSSTGSSGRFYVDVSQLDPVREDLRHFSVEGAAAINAGFTSNEWEPASPADILRRCARNVLNAAQNGRGLPRGIHVHPVRGAISEDRQEALLNASGEMEELTPAREVLRFLSTHPKDHALLFKKYNVSQILKRTLLPATFTTLPSSRRNSPRQKDEDDSTYAAAWIMTELSPEELGPRGKEWIAGRIESDYPLDILLCPGGLKEMKRLERAQTRVERRQEPQDTGEDHDDMEDVTYTFETSSNSSSSSSEQADDEDTDRIFRNRSRLLFQNDALPPAAHPRSPEQRGRPTPYPSSSSTSNSTSDFRSSEGEEGERESQQIPYTVGTLFTHLRYSYKAVITGWDPICSAYPDWIVQMGVDTLPNGGRRQPFYHVFVEDETKRYVAHCHIVPLEKMKEVVVEGGGGEVQRNQPSSSSSSSLSTLLEFIPLLQSGSLGRDFRSLDVRRCRLRKSRGLSLLFPDDGSDLDEEE